MPNKSLNIIMKQAVIDFKKKHGSIVPAMPGLQAIANNAIIRNFAENGRTNNDKGDAINLFSGGNKPWVKLANSTVKRYTKKGYELVPTLNRRGHLKRQTEVKIKGKTSLVFSSNSKYGMIHNYGGTITINPHERTIKFKATKSKKTIKDDKDKERWNGKYNYRFSKSKSKGKNVIERKTQIKSYKITIPARPFLTLAPSDLKEMANYIIKMTLK